ncbi:YitT family protein [uncultured Thomasclavelia sp.]|uniref:YitT family protein n=1 Tax=uncultured Thomasclavelia sp. TaxID=3025759 RepID=UPI0025E03A80|nr:YitT family protein [uncultured Thomasclavelia sp.]
MKKKVWFRYLVTIVAVIASSFLQTYAIKVFVNQANLLSSGFTGVAILIERITSLYGFSFSTSLGMIVLNLPVAILCYKSIGKKFVISSLCQVFLTSFLLQVCSFPPLFDDIILNVCFGGFVYGIATVIALKGNASTAGTDFIALYVSNKSGKSIWGYVFIFNTCILCIFGYMFGWIYAGYSIVFQFISTRTISSFYQRYKRVTLQITTKEPEKLVAAYIKQYRHGVSVLNGYGGYSKEPMSLLHTVVSAYEVQDIVQLLHEFDSKAIINVIPTENFIGGFYQAPLD